MSGLLITFEGTEGAGKTTQIGLLADALRSAGHTVLVTREPGGTPFGVRLRGMLLEPGGDPPAPYAELFLYLADRAQHVRDVIAPALERGTLVLCDRFADATAAYQGVARGLDREVIARANRAATGGLRPDLTLLLEFERVEVGLERARRRQAGDGTAGVEDRFERERVEFHRLVRQGYRELAAAEPGRFTVLPAELPVPELQARIGAAVRERLARAAAAAGA
jgi:dTMP kinase